MNKHKLIIAGITLGVGVVTSLMSSARTIDIINKDYNNIITDIVVFHSNNKDNNPTVVSCNPKSIIGPGQDCLIQFPIKARGILSLNIKSKQKDKQGKNILDSTMEIETVPDGTLINKFPSYDGPPNGLAADYADENNYSVVKTDFRYKPNGGISNPNRNDEITIESI